MRKNDKKQRRSLLFSTAVVVTGCLLTAFYVNQEMPKSEYEVDLSQLSAEQKQEDLAGDMRTGDAGVAKVAGNDVQNPVIAAETDAAIHVSEWFRKKGFRTCILKGQGNAMMYPNPCSRTPGDFDIWVEGGDKRAGSSITG